MKLHNLPIMLILLSIIVLSAVSYVTDLGTNYGVTADLDGLNATQERLNKTITDSEELKGAIDQVTLQDDDASAFLIPYYLIKVGWKMLKTMFGSWSTTMAMVNDASTTSTGMGVNLLPAWIIGGIQAILIISLISILVYGFWKWKFEN